MKSIILVWATLVTMSPVLAQDITDPTLDLVSIRQRFGHPYIESSFEFIVQQNYEQALADLWRLGQTSPGDSKIIYYRAWCHYVNGEVFKAYEDVNRYLKMSKIDPYVGYILLGRIEYSRMLPQNSIEMFDKAISMEPGNKLAYLEKAQVYATSNNLKEGIRFINKAFKMFPQEVEFLLWRGLLLRYEQSFNKASADFSSYVEQSKDSTHFYLAFIGLAKCEIAQKSFDNALKHANLGLTLAPDFSPGYGIRGEIYYRTNNYEMALRDFKKMRERGMENIYYFEMIGISYEKAGNKDEVCEYYRKNCGAANTQSCTKYKKLRCAN